MSTGNQQQNQNRPIRFNGIEGLLSAIGVGACAIGGYISTTNGLDNYNNQLTLQLIQESSNNPRVLTAIGIGAASAFILGIYRLGRRHGRN